ALLLYIEESIVWKIHFDRSFTFHGSGASVVLITPSGDPIPQAFHLVFPYTKNIAEYEELISRMKLAIKWNIHHVKVVGDSQLIIKQVNDEYKVKDEKLIPYKKLVETLKEYFVRITFEQIPRAQNRSADAMATVGSMLCIPPGNNDMPFFVENFC
ncbi:hypothetical protein KI387_023623, partial [Taxus chinensis]